MENSTSFSMDLNLLPYPAQASIIQNVDKADDILSLLQVFPGGDFESVAAATKCEWLFQNVLPSLLPHFSLGDTLKCRRVCQRWKKAVDNTLENVGLAEPEYSQTLATIHEETFRGDWTKRPFAIPYPWNTDEQAIFRFVREMDGHSGNPFPFRSVTFDNLNWDNPAVCENVKQLLQRFGKHVWKLNVSTEIPAHQSALLLRDLLQWTPNLRRLELELNDAEVPDLPAQEQQEIERRLRDSGFPALPHLTYLDYLLGRAFYRFALPKYSEHLVRLEVTDGRGYGFLESYDPEQHGSFPKLKLLEVWVENERQLRKLTQMGSPLQNLTIFCASRIPLSRHLEVCHHFAQTLECVTVDFDTELGNDTRERLLYTYSGNDEDMQFPQLVTLSLNNPSPLESLDVLLTIQPGLKTLHILGHLEEPELLFQEMAGETIKIHGFLDRIYESAVWKKMPRLETVKIEVFDEYEDLIEDVYTRTDLAEKEDTLE